MKESSDPGQKGLFLALMHHPVTNKRGDIISSAVTNLDLHDIARAAKTYGVNRYFVVTPLVDQQALAKKILGHWITGAGAAYNPDRKEALLLARVAANLDMAIDDAQRLCGQRPAVVVTDARQRPGTIGHDDLTKLIKNGKPCLLVFGTAWGLTEDFIARADFVLEPICGPGDYNHLSVRSAVAIILDRIAGQRAD